MDKCDLEERLITFSVLIIEIVNEMPNTKAGNHLSGQNENRKCTERE